MAIARDQKVNKYVGQGPNKTPSEIFEEAKRRRKTVDLGGQTLTREGKSLKLRSKTLAMHDGAQWRTQDFSMGGFDVSFSDVTAYNAITKKAIQIFHSHFCLILCASYRSEKVSQKLELSIRG